LDDLCLEPVNKLDKANRKIMRKKYIQSLASRISVYKPMAICLVMKGISNEVHEAINISRINIQKIIYNEIRFPFSMRFPESAQSHLDFLNGLKAQRIISL